MAKAVKGAKWRALRLAWKSEKKKNEEILEGIEACMDRLRKIGAAMEGLAEAHQVVDEAIQDLHKRTPQRGSSLEGEKARGEEWRTLQDQMNEIWERMEDEEEAENHAIWERDDLQEAAPESAGRVRTMKKQVTGLREEEAGGERVSDSEVGPEDWESSEEERQEGAYPDTDWEDG